MVPSADEAVDASWSCWGSLYLLKGELDTRLWARSWRTLASWRGLRPVLNGWGGVLVVRNMAVDDGARDGVRGGEDDMGRGSDGAMATAMDVKQPSQRRRGGDGGGGGGGGNRPPHDRLSPTPASLCGAVRVDSTCRGASRTGAVSPGPARSEMPCTDSVASIRLCRQNFNLGGRISDSHISDCRCQTRLRT